MLYCCYRVVMQLAVLSLAADRRLLPHQLVPGCHSDAVLGDEEARDVAHAGRTEAVPDVEQQHAGEQLGAGRMLRRTHQVRVAHRAQGAPPAAAAGTTRGSESSATASHARACRGGRVAETPPSSSACWQGAATDRVRRSSRDGHAFAARHCYAAVSCSSTLVFRDRS